MVSEIPDGLRYTEDHEYVAVTDESGVYQIGITDYAQGELGDVVYVELPMVGEIFEKKATFGTIEAVKAVSDLNCPVAGEIVAINESLDDDPSLINSDPYGTGWMIRLRVGDEATVDALMDGAAYQALVGE